MKDLVITGAIPRPLTATVLEAAVRASCIGAKKPEGAVSIAFVSSDKIRQLNRKWRKKNRPTDVLSFSPAAVLKVKKGEVREWGDLFLCSTYIRHSAKEQGVPFHEEALRVTIHGMLHLFGYDHAEVKDEKRMFALQERILTSVLTNV